MRSIVNSARDRRALIMGLVGISLTIGIGRVLPAWQRWRYETSSAANQLKREVERSRNSIAHGRLFQDSLAVRRKRFMALAPLLVSGHTTAMGSAALASVVSTAAATANMRLGPLRVDPDTASRGVFSRVRVRAELTGDVRGVAAFLSAIEGGTPLIAIRELTVSQLEPSAPPERAEALQVGLMLEALMLTPRGAKSGSPSRSAGQHE